MSRARAWALFVFGAVTGASIATAAPSSAEEAHADAAAIAVAPPRVDEERADAAAASELEQLRLVMMQASRGQRARRHGAAFAQAAGGALHLGVGITVMAREGVERLARPEQVFGLANTIVGGALLLTSPLSLVFMDRGELLHEELERDLREHPRDRAGVLARGEQRLADAAASARTERLFSLAILGTVTLAEAAIFVWNEARADWSSGLRYGIGSALLAGAAGTFVHVFPSELERLADLWRNNPLRRPARTGAQLRFAPVQGGALATYGGTF